MFEEQYADYKVCFEPKGTYLYVFVTGPKDTLDISKSFTETIHLKAVELGYKRVLIEEDFPNQLSTMEMYAVAKIGAEMYSDYEKIAHVDKSMVMAELNQFGETVAVNRGLYAKAFSNKTAAEEWLLE